MHRGDIRRFSLIAEAARFPRQSIDPMRQSTHAPRIPVSAAVKVVNAAAAAGIAADDLCRAVGIDPDVITDVDAEIAFSQLLELFEAAARLAGDTAFGLHAGERFDAREYGLLGYVTIHSATFGEALERVIRYQRIRTDAVEFTLDVAGATARLTYAYRDALPPELGRHESEQMLATMLEAGRRLTGIAWVPLEVCLRHSRPGDVSEHERVFGHNIHFERPHARLAFDASILTLPLAQADVTLGSLLERQAAAIVASVPQREAFAQKVGQVIRENLAGGARVDVVARALGLSTRSLQRKLRQESTSFEQLLHDEQRALAELYLRNHDMAIGEIAYLTGFSQPSAFHRAFRRWTGITPQQFRAARLR